MVLIARLLALLLASLLASSPTLAQAPSSASSGLSGSPPAIQAGQVPDPVAKPVKATLEGARAELEQQEAALRRPNLSATDLQDLRARIEPVAERLRDTIAELTPLHDAAKARLDQLGAKPKEGSPPEGPEVSRDRAERATTLAAFDDSQRLARTLLLQSEQLTAQISDRRRSAFTSALFERSYSIVSPDLWVSIARSLPRDLRAFRLVVDDAVGRIETRTSPGTLTILGLVLGVAIALHIARRQIAPRLARRSQRITEVSQGRRVLAALAILAVEFGPAAAGSFVVYQVVVALDLVPPRLYAVLSAILGGVAFVAFLRAGLHALLAPGRQAWRLVGTGGAAAARTTSFVVAFGAIVATGKVLDALGQAIAAALPLSVATRAVIAALAVSSLAELLRRFANETAPDEQCLGPYIPSEPEAGAPLRTLGWAIVALVVAALLTGYVAFAAFVVDQIAWVGSIAIVLRLAVAATDECLGHTLTKESRIATALQANLGLRRRALEQFGVLGSGVARVVLVILALMLALAPWGVESGDLASDLRAAFFGFKVGDVTISLSTTVLAILLFGIAIAVTRVLQRWLETTFLPTTELDAGLRNSIGTAIGYLGFFAAVAIGFAYLGLSLEKVALVAGALSVGIGFGLQSIVNNFVSGLILLWERPIRVGDLVIVGDSEGYVRRISVRATEIETLDRAMIIVPNSNLISGIVKNRVRGDQTGRAVVSINVLRNQDPARAAQILIDRAAQHPDVRGQPPPQVFFKKIGDTWLEFDLVCVVDDVTKLARVQSDLNFAVFGAVVQEGILPPLGPGSMNVGGLEPVQSALQHIADAIGDARARRPGTPAGDGTGPAPDGAR